MKLRKRAELLCRTKNGFGRGLISVKDLIKNAAMAGMPAIGIADECSVDAFPDAERYYNEFVKEGVINPENFRVVYGVELHVFDDSNCKVTPADFHHIMRLDRFQVVLYAKNQKGIRDLYYLLSLRENAEAVGMFSLSEVEKCRENLVIGVHVDPDRLNVVDWLEFYPAFCRRFDFVLVEPIENYYKSGPLYETKKDCWEIRNVIKRFLNEIKDDVCVIGTANPCFLSPDYAYSYKAYLSGLFSEGYPKRGFNPQNYLSITDEKITGLFADFLGEELAEEIVLKNPLKILEKIGDVHPVNKKKAYPVYPDADKKIRSICKKNAEAIYGKKLPEPVKKRLMNELGGITGNGFASHYMIAEKIAEKAKEDNVPFNLRGNGSGSFVSYLLGITSVNPLPPHYRCGACNYTEFSGPWKEMLPVGNTGLDLPDKKCPQCNKKLIKDGFDIPYYFFLGYHCDREPDFDFNFPDDYQKTIQKYVTEIDGISYACHAGTMQTYTHDDAERQLFWYMRREKKEIDPDDYLKQLESLENKAFVRNAHPGGVVIIPDGVDIYEYTPVVEKERTNLGIITGLNYYSLDYSFVKLDLLRNSMLSCLTLAEKYSKKKIKDIPQPGKKLFKLFTSPEDLGFKGKCPKGITSGILGIAAFGAYDFQKFLTEGKPESYTDVIRLMGEYHGTGVWNENAQDLISGNTAEIKDCIAHREDIYLYLTGKGIEDETAWKIAEQCRKGRFKAKGLPVEWEELMLSHDVPAWYIESMKQIRYLFPKAHSASYAIVGLELLYYKLNYPEAFYRAWLESCREEVDKRLLLEGRKAIEKAYNKAVREDPFDNPSCKKFADELLIVLEMYARGIDVKKLICTVLQE